MLLLYDLFSLQWSISSFLLQCWYCILTFLWSLEGDLAFLCKFLSEIFSVFLVFPVKMKSWISVSTTTTTKKKQTKTYPKPYTFFSWAILCIVSFVLICSTSCRHYVMGLFQVTGVFSNVPDTGDRYFSWLPTCDNCVQAGFISCKTVIRTHVLKVVMSLYWQSELIKAYFIQKHSGLKFSCLLVYGMWVLAFQAN